ncbi:MAG: LysE family transporter [Parabacteroides sp.]|nr:LysE family transporter [Parabacteroides sp.]
MDLLMGLMTLTGFTATVFPLVITPGPDILFIISQTLAKGRREGFKATLGVLLGYILHGILAAFGLAALVTSSPLAYVILRWSGGY